LPTRNTMMNRFLFRRVVTKLLCNSEHTRRMVLSENPRLIPYERTFVVFNGLDLAAFDSLPVNPLVPRQAVNVVIGCAGRLTEQKGHVYLLEAAALLRERGVNATFLLAGSGELEDSLRSRVAELDLDESVHLLGFVEDMKGFYASIDILALPSLWEGFGYVLSEAMSMRLPVVAFDTSNIPEVVVDGETGLLVPPRDVAAFANALETLIRDSGLRLRFGLAGRERVEHFFSLAKTTRALEDVLLVSV